MSDKYKIIYADKTTETFNELPTQIPRGASLQIIKEPDSEVVSGTISVYLKDED